MSSASPAAFRPNLRDPLAERMIGPGKAWELEPAMVRGRAQQVFKGMPRNLAGIFRRQVMPLLQEYFFEDWQRIQWVLNDHRKPKPEHRFVRAQPWNVKELFGDDVTVSGTRQAWSVNEDAFALPESYLGLIDHVLPT